MAPNSEDPYFMDWNLISPVYSELHLLVLNFQVDKHHEKAKLSKVHPGGSEQSGVSVFTGKKENSMRMMLISGNKQS